MYVPILHKKGNIMERTAQKRSLLNKLREMTNVSGLAAEKFFNPEFKRVMESLRLKDDQIRSIASGEAIGEGDPGNDPISLKDLFKSATSNANKREFMSTVADLGRFHKKLFDITQEISQLKFDVDAVHHEFLFKDLDDQRKMQLHELKNRFARTKRMSIIKEASIMDFFMNIGTKRGRALAAWEKRYPKQVGKLKKDTISLLGKTSVALSQTLTSLKEMASARATRNVDAYVKSAEKILKAYQAYDAHFKTYYAENIKGFLEKVELIPPSQPVAKEEAKEMGKQDIPVGVPATIPADQMDTLQPATVSEPIPLVVQKAPDTIPVGAPNMSVPPPATEPSPPAGSNTEFKSDQLAKEMWGKAAHQKFIASLEALGEENPIILAAYINKYAKSIQANDPVTAIGLFKIANNMRK
jgi:hypothetical protein